jgi:hypothetical protein
MLAQAGTGQAWVEMTLTLACLYSHWSRAKTSLALFTNSKLQEKREMKIGSLFSGYGGLDLAVSKVLNA